jgi:hypothetical protein
VEIGQPTGIPDPAIDGLIVRDRNGKTLLHANGFGVEIAGTEQLNQNAVVSIHNSEDSNIAFHSYPTAGITSLWTIRVLPDYNNVFARLVMTTPQGNYYHPLGVDWDAKWVVHPIVNLPLVIAGNFGVFGWVEEISNSDLPGIPRNTWYRASSYPFARRNPYKITVLEVKR